MLALKAICLLVAIFIPSVFLFHFLARTVEQKDHDAIIFSAGLFSAAIIGFIVLQWLM